MTATVGGFTVNEAISAGKLPAEMVDSIWSRVEYESAILRVAGTTPVAITGNVIPTVTGDIVAGIVGEGEAKPIVKAGLELKTFKPVKAAAIMYWSKEARQANPANYLKEFESKMTQAIAKAVDMAVIHGKDALKNAQITGVEYLAQSTTTMELGTNNAKSGGIGADIIDGYSKVVELADQNYDFTGFLADQRMKPKLMGAVDLQGRPLFQTSLDLSAKMDNLAGLPTTYTRAVSGKIGAVADTKTRLIGGDFANIKVGFVNDITIKQTDTATLVDGDKTVPLWQQNMEAYLVEAQFAWVIRDVNAFCVYTDKVPDVKPQ